MLLNLLYRIAGNFCWSKFSRKSSPPEEIFAVLFSRLALVRAINHAPLSSPGLQRTKDLPWETVGRRLPVWNSDAVPLSDRARLQCTKRKCKNSTSPNVHAKVHMFKFILRFLFLHFGRGSRKSQKFGLRENFLLYGTLLPFYLNLGACFSESQGNPHQQFVRVPEGQFVWTPHRIRAVLKRRCNQQ